MRLKLKQSNENNVSVANILVNLARKLMLAEYPSTIIQDVNSVKLTVARLSLTVTNVLLGLCYVNY